jgi:hypothetical protein
MRITPEITADRTNPPLPDHFRRRYIDGQKVVLPCNDQKIADTVTCDDYIVYCWSPNDRITLSVMGKGNSYLVDQTCGEFFAGERVWSEVQSMLENDIQKFVGEFEESPGKMKERRMPKVSYENKFRVRLSSETMFDFSYSFGWRFNSKCPECFVGDQMKLTQGKCALECAGDDCLLESSEIGSPKVDASNLPFKIPTKELAMF